MKKSFFKKLSFVMAAAMTMALVAPAAGAFGATAPKLNSVKKYLHLDAEDGSNDYNFNITTTKGKGWNYVWESSDEDVAVVDESNGVTTATGVGSAKITVFITDKDGEEVGDASATVIVRDNIKTLAIANKPEKDTVAVDQPFDFNRTFTTVSGSTTVTSSVTRWTVTPAEGAAITDAGVFTATKAGEYTVKAVAFQSKEKYTTWKADPTANAALVLASAETKVTVGVSVKDVKLVTPTQIAITFDSSVKDLVDDKSDVTVNNKLTETVSAMMPVKSFDSISADGKTVTVSTYDALADKQTYKVTAAGATFELYAQIGTPVSISMNDQTVPAGASTKLAYTLLDQYNVNVASLFDTSANLHKNSSIPFDTNKAGYLTLGNDQVSFVEYNYLIVNADGTTKTISTGTKTVKGVAATAVGSSLEWNIGNYFTTTAQTIKVGTNAVIYGRVKKSDGTYTTTSAATSLAQYKFESLNEAVLMVDTNTNTLIPVSAGKAVVKVTDRTSATGATVTYIEVTVLALPTVNSVKASATSVVLSNSIANVGTEQTTVNIINVDQYGTETPAVIVPGESYALSNAANLPATVIENASSLAISADASETGAFNYLVTATDAAGNNKHTVTISISVVAPGLLNGYSITANQTSIDAFVANTSSAPTSVTFTVYGVDANGIKKELVKPGAVTGQSITYSLTNPDGAAQTVGFTNAGDGTATFSVNDLTGTFKTGNYTFTVDINGIKYAKTVAVTNSRPAATASVSSLSATVSMATAVSAAVDQMLDVKIGDTTVIISDVLFYSNNSLVVANDADAFVGTGSVRIYITKVKTMAGGIEQSVDINQSFTLTVQ